MKPKLRFPEQKLPLKTKLYGEICVIKTGKRDTQNAVLGGEYPFYVRSQTPLKINTWSLDRQAIITAGDGVGVGKVYHFAEGKFDFHQRVYALYDFEDDVNVKYAYYHFSSRFGRRVSRLSAKNSVDSVRMEMIANMNIALPSLSEQKMVSSLLTAIDYKINLLTKKKQALEAYKKGLMQKIFSQELRFKREDGTDFDLWNDFKFETICKRENSGLTNRELAPEGIIAVYGAAGHIEGYSDGHAQPSSFVSIVKDGAGVGRVRLLPKDTSATGTLDIIIPDEELVTAHFLYLLLSTIKWERFMVGSTIPHIYFRDWKKLRVCVPSVKEQLMISSVIASIEKQIVILNGNIGKVQKLKKGLLQQMFV